MKHRMLESKHDGKRFRIEEDYPEVGSYLYVYEGENCIRDHLQQSVEACIQLASEEYGVPVDSWGAVE